MNKDITNAGDVQGLPAKKASKYVRDINHHAYDLRQAAEDSKNGDSQLSIALKKQSEDMFNKAEAALKEISTPV